MTIEEFSSYIISLFSFSAGTMIVSLANRFGKTDKRRFIIKPETKSVINGLYLLACSLFIWTLSGFIRLNIKNEETAEIYKLFFSIINSIFLLLGAIYIEFSPDWLKTKSSKNQIRIIVVGALMIILTLIFYLLNSISLIMYLPDLLLSFFTIIILLYSFTNTFWIRGYKLLAVYASITLLLLLLAQLPSNLYDLSKNFISLDSLILTGLYSRLSFIIIIVLLANSWINSQFKLATLEIKELKKQVKSERENALSDERELAWQNIGMIAHQLGNPIISLESKMESIVRKLNAKDTKAARIVLEEMKNPLEEAKTLIEQYKSFGKQENLNQTECSLRKLVESCSRYITDEEAFVKIDCTINTNLRLDKEKITSCFSELFANAKRWFDKEYRTITITIEEIEKNEIPSILNQDKRYIKTSFEDNGIGVEDKNKNDIFLPFVTTHKHGFGLGLSIVSKIIKQHGGFIEETGVFGEGAKFDIYLPIN